MPKTPDRMADLPPEKKQLLEKLLRGGEPRAAAVTAPLPKGLQAGIANRAASMATSASQRVPSVQPSPPLTLASFPEVKQGYQRFYDAVSTQLDSSVFGEFAFFLNYGYVPNLDPQFSQVTLPDHFINKNSVRLVLEVIGDCPLKGRRALDVGCGRGGTVYVMHSFFDPVEITGIDLSAAAIAFCQKTHRYAGVRFEQGDAEHLPFADRSFDVVTNIESSHLYPDINAFYTEVYRVMTPGGHFLYTDVHSVDEWRQEIKLLEMLGFIVERERDITANVLLSCDDVAQNRMHAFDRGNDFRQMQNFLATPGSEVYVEMSKRRWKYNLLKLRKLN